jgi:hypothetical protein
MSHEPGAASGESDLAALIRGMRPFLREGVYAFVTLPPNEAVPSDIEPVMTFAEDEGLTLIVRGEAAEAAGLAATFPCRMITLEAHSALSAVGFLAAITTALAGAGIGVNPVAAYHHDHLFVPAERAEEALRILERLTDS